MPNSLRLLDYSDRELLAIVHEEAEATDDGWAETADIAATVSIDHERPRQCVGARLSWLRQYKVVEKKKAKSGPSRWRLTPIGQVFLNGTLPEGAEAQLKEMEPGQLYSVTRFLAGRQRSSAKPVGHMLRREWIHGTGRR